MSYIPHLRQPPTQTESGNAVPSNISSPSLVSVGNGKGNTTVTTEASTDPFGPRQWHSNLVKLGGKDRALNEFSVERIGEEVDENLVMLHGAPSPTIHIAQYPLLISIQVMEQGWASSIRTLRG